ncbi:hypothetical protein ELY33_16950 [Vreelandella andesensis]|uniref:GIY-YIG nuclease family protein n=1 Tax=Vreelandella andesensis TaxID=447567 RepID=A0A433KF43_9GAMM|nr:hypothetical protein [Halomonas andesensis]RUR26795.1 hypothetical protein ELY33_16950 [Halomonas andesensis]
MQEQYVSTSQLCERYGRPDFIPREVFRQWIGKSRMNKLIEVDGVTAAGYIYRWENKGKPIKSRQNLYRPIDIIARARAKNHIVRPPKVERVRNTLASLEARYAELEAATTNMPHQINMHQLSSSLTDRRLLTAKEIVKNSGKTPHLTGVYFLIKDENVVYVGQSVNIISRVAAHVKQKDFDRFAFVPCDAQDLDVLESLYIHFLQPELNGLLNGDNGHHAPLSLPALIGYKRKSA